MGDHCGFAQYGPPKVVAWRRFVPSAFETHISGFPVLVDTNAMRLPSRE